MKLFENFSLNEKISIYVPSTVNVNEKIDTQKNVIDVSKKLASIFGGSTAIKTNGNYISNDGILVTEEITVVYAFCTTEDLEKNEDEIIAICENLKIELKQECIALEVSNKMYFI
jgi:hypothetical protein